MTVLLGKWMKEQNVIASGHCWEQCVCSKGTVCVLKIDFGASFIVDNLVSRSEEAQSNTGKIMLMLLQPMTINFILYSSCSLRIT